MTEINCPHDKTFKSLMADTRVAKNFFKNYLPQNISKLVDFNSLKLCLNSFVNTEFNTYHSDVLYSALIAGRSGFLYLLCEHQSKVDELLPFRVWQYIINIWANDLKQSGEKTLPLVIPLIFYHGRTPYNKSLDIRDLIAAPMDLIEEILFKKIHIIDTHSIANEDLREQCWSDIMTFVFKNIFVRDFTKHIDQFLSMLNHLSKIEPIDDRMSSFLEILIKYLWNVSEMTEPKVLIERAKTELPSTLGENIMNPAQYFKNEGHKEGIQQGMEQGIQVSHIKLLSRLIQNKFGCPPSHPYMQKINEASLSQIETWVDRILIAKSLNDLFETEIAIPEFAEQTS